MTNIELYSHRDRPGHIPEKEVVDDLASYIKLFSDGQLENYYFRGEPTNYQDTISSALRGKGLHSYIEIKEEFHKEYPFFYMKNKFKREVWHKLSSDERMHFSAFSQHHGIPTNLIDITSSPLVALYFACQEFEAPGGNKQDFDQERGFVYLFEDSFVDITNILNKFEDDDILELFAYNRRNAFIDMYNIFLDFQNKHPKKFYQYLKKLNEEYYAYFGRMPGEHLILEDLPNPQGHYEIIITAATDKIINNDDKLKKIYNQIDDISDVVFLYTASLQIFLKNLLDGEEFTHWFENIMPNFKYEPILSFERGRNQQGLFIYQTYLNYIHSPFKIRTLTRQRVSLDKIFVINNKKKILDELDFIGINEKFIYGDYDNIAKYIKRKFQ
ncbi:FRG domain-containing protein [Bacillus cereus group sp. BceL212]|jgi:hypothetical protein|uniref:FRG domain-containing protein n=1 Tax=Bacillus cereus group sp. BceL212 TaxID=3445018 RepID=UPI00046F2E06